MQTPSYFMQPLNLPQYPFNIKTIGGKLSIFDDFRKKFVSLTPEEWVRQHIIKYLVEDKAFPAGLVSIEAEINVNNLRRRYDGLVFTRTHTPLLLIECKAPSVKITQKVFDQIFAYNTQVIAPYLLITNGLQHFLLKMSANNTPEFIQSIPNYTALTSC